MAPAPTPLGQLVDFSQESFVGTSGLRRICEGRAFANLAISWPITSLGMRDRL